LELLSFLMHFKNVSIVFRCLFGQCICVVTVVYLFTSQFLSMLAVIVLKCMTASNGQRFPVRLLIAIFFLWFCWRRAIDIVNNGFLHYAVKKQDFLGDGDKLKRVLSLIPDENILTYLLIQYCFESVICWSPLHVYCNADFFPNFTVRVVSLGTTCELEFVSVNEIRTRIIAW